MKRKMMAWMLTLGLLLSVFGSIVMAEQDKVTVGGLPTTESTSAESSSDTDSSTQVTSEPETVTREAKEATEAKEDALPTEGQQSNLRNEASASVSDNLTESAMADATDASESEEGLAGITESKTDVTAKDTETSEAPPLDKQNTRAPKKVKGTIVLVGAKPLAEDGVIRPDQYEYWEEGIPFEADEDSILWDVFIAELTAKKYQIEGEGWMYPKSVTNPQGIRLTGEDSKSWMWLLNGDWGPSGANDYRLKAGEESVFTFYFTYDWSDALYKGDPDAYEKARFEQDSKPEIQPNPGASHADVGSVWDHFRGDGTNNGVRDLDEFFSEYEISESAKIKLREMDDWMTFVGSPIIIGNDVVVSVGRQIWFIGPDGTVNRQIDLRGAPGYFCRIAYRDGVLVVPLDGGSLQAISVETGETLWLTAKVPAIEGANSQANSTVVIEDGKVYFGTTNYFGEAKPTKGYFLVFDLLSGERLLSYFNESASYYWTGAVKVGQWSLITDDKGAVRVYNPADFTAPVSQLQLAVPSGEAATVRAMPVSHEGHVYLVAREGFLFDLVLAEDGKLSVHQVIAINMDSTSTPAIADGKAYLGGMGAQWNGLFAVVDLTTQQVSHYDVPANVQSSPLVLRGTDGRVLVLFSFNAEPGGVYVYDSLTDQVKPVYLPEGDAANYSTGSLILGANNQLYYANDSGYLFGLSLNLSGVVEPTEIVIRNEKQGMTIRGTSESLELGWQLVVEEKPYLNDDYEITWAREIYLADAQGNPVQPKNQLQVKVEVENLAGLPEEAVLYKLNAENQPEPYAEYTLDREKGLLNFTTDSFSFWLLAVKRAIGGSEQPTESGQPTVSEEAPSTAVIETKASAKQATPISKTGESSSVMLVTLMLALAGSAIVVKRKQTQH